MARPIKLKNSANAYFRKRIPADVQRLLEGLPKSYRPPGWGREVVKVSLGVHASDSAAVAAAQARVAADVSARIAELRKGVRRLTQKEAVEMAGEAYREFQRAFEEDPGEASAWWDLALDNERAKAGRFGPQLTIGEEARVTEAMEYRFGPFADLYLARRGIVTDGESRRKLIVALGDALTFAYRKLALNAEGDYSPDPLAERFPAPSPPLPAPEPPAPKGPTVGAVFDLWREAQVRLNKKPKTLARYAPCLRSLDTWAKGRPAASLTEDDIWEWAEHRAGNEGVSPKTINRVDLAAVKSVFQWAASRPGKRILSDNPARAIRLPEPSGPITRRPLFTHEEAASIMTAASLVPDSAENPTLAYAKRWTPWIAAYTGARITEICQLRGVDVRQEGGVWVMDFTPLAGSIKTDEARTVPIHEHLIAKGFLDFVRQRGPGPLFYDPLRRKAGDAKYSQAENRGGDVATWVRAAVNLDPRIRPSHTWRKVFKSIAVEAGIDDRLSDWISGHMTSKRKRGAAAIYEVPTIKGLASAIAKFPRYPVT
jgi:integrase